ncbi:MAG: threonylcarbamoyl-AMP synthase [Spirochaetaceae bacterium]|nr:MAG: threonylcarbamoyl-AMP synthase [Spirochaetaceae bacterium]
MILDPAHAWRAADILRAGGLVVFPTETVYGLGANAFDPRACSRIFAAKGRPTGNPLIVHLAGLDQLPLVAQRIEPAARLLLERFSPGPFTIIVPRSQRIPDVVTAGLCSVAVRIPSSPVARAILTHCGFPVAAPSANRSGRPSPTDFDSALEHMDGRVEAIVRGPDCEIGLESTVVRVESGRVRVLREGAVTREMLREAIADLARLDAAAGNSAESGSATVELCSGPEYGALDAAEGPAEAPGTRYRHYRPEAALIAVERADLAVALDRYGGCATALLALRPLQSGEVQHRGCSLLFGFDSLDHYARELYRCLRACDQGGCETIIAELPPAAGMGRALRDRLLRAAGRY